MSNFLFISGALVTVFILPITILGLSGGASFGETGILIILASLAWILWLGAKCAKRVRK